MRCIARPLNIYIVLRERPLQLGIYVVVGVIKQQDMYSMYVYTTIMYNAAWLAVTWVVVPSRREKLDQMPVYILYSTIRLR